MTFFRLAYSFCTLDSNETHLSTTTITLVLDQVDVVGKRDMDQTAKSLH